MDTEPGRDRGQEEDEDETITTDIQESFAPEPAGAVEGGEAAATEAEGGTAAAEAGVAAWADAQTALEDLQARYLRLSADFENYRRRTLREALERARYGAEEAAMALLPVLDNLRRAVEHAPEGTNGEFLDGLQHTVRQFEDALAAVGVAPIEAEGQPFDPSLHEAVLGEESDGVEVDTVVMDLRRGYRLHDRVLRPSMVKVAHPAQAAGEG